MTENKKLLIENLITNSAECEWIEYKHNVQDPDQIGEYISALSNSALLHNEHNAYMLWGINDGTKEKIGTSFNPITKKGKGNQDLILWLKNLITPSISFNFETIIYDDYNIVVLTIPAAKNYPTAFQNARHIRIGSHKTNIKNHPDLEAKLFEILSKSNFETMFAKEYLSVSDILNLLDFSSYFRLFKRPIPENNSNIIALFEQDSLIYKNNDGSYNITNLGALLFAKDLRDFDGLSDKYIRFTRYKSDNKLDTLNDKFYYSGYAISFKEILDTIEDFIPKNEIIETALRQNISLYPLVAIREFFANAIVHQDFSVLGSRPTIELYKHRIEITNPGKPLVDTLRFIDEPPKTRNEKLSNFLLRINICEKRGSGIDRAINAIELFQLPAPKIIEKTDNVVVIIYAPRDFKDMSMDDRIRACYQHACLLQVDDGKALTNSSLKARFGNKPSSALISQVIKATLDQKFIKSVDSTLGNRSSKYIPFWA